MQLTLLESTTDYPIPFPDDTPEGVARIAHREWYWRVHDYDSYECPDCNRGIPRVDSFDVHHKDGNPRNGHPSNLVALCRRCHRWRHGDKNLSALDLEEWKEAFLDPEYEL